MMERVSVGGPWNNLSGKKSYSAWHWQEVSACRYWQMQQHRCMTCGLAQTDGTEPAAGSGETALADKKGSAKTGTQKPGMEAAGKDSVNPVQKADDLRRTREVDFSLQRGQLLSEAIGDIDGDGVEEVVDLMGNPLVDKSSYMGDMYLIVRETALPGPTG